MRSMSGNFTAAHRESTTAFRHLAMVFIAVAVVFVLVYLINLSDRSVQWLLNRGVDGLQIGEFVIVLAVLTFAFSVFSLRRQRELKAEVSRRKRVEEELHWSEAKLRSVAQAVRDGIVITDTNNRIVFWNEGATRIFGYTEEEVLGQPLTTFVPETARSDHEAAMARMQRTGNHPLSVQRREFCGLRKDGSGFPLEISFAAWEVGEERFFSAMVHDLTERRQREKALQESEERYRTIFETTGAATVIIEEDTTISLANTEFERLFGYSKGELEGRKRWTELIVKDDLARMRDWHRLRRTDPSAAPSNYEFRGFDKQGNVRDCLLSIAMIPGTGRSVASILDITQCKRSEEVLHQSEVKFRSVAQSANDGIIVTDSRGKIAFWNKAAETIFGYEEQEALGQPLTIWLPEAHRDSHQAGIGQMKESGCRALVGQRREFRGLRKDGSEFPLEISFATWELGEETYDSALVRDITDRKCAEENIEQALDWYEAIFEGSRDAIFICDLNSQFTAVNHAASELTGYSKDELLSMRIPDLHEGTDLEAYQKHHDRIVAGEEIVDEAEILTKDGRKVCVEFNNRRIVIANTAYTHTVARDITERKQADERQAQLLKDLENANRELNQLIYVASHDLKAPLRAVGSLANWLSTDYADKLGKDGQELIELLFGRVERMDNFIEGILQYLRVGRVKEEKEVVNLDELVTNVIEMLAPPAHISISVDATLPTIVCEKTRMQQVFQNLLDNAVKFMDKPEGQIRIACERDDGDWKFSVSDNGPGIEEKHFMKIFQIFQTLSPRDRFEGTGVGLTVAKKIVEAHGGRIWVQSKVGDGSTFYFSLPASRE